MNFTESADRAELERADAAKRAKELELQLETLWTESQTALEQAREDAKKHEEKTRTQATKNKELAARLRPVAEALSSK